MENENDEVMMKLVLYHINYIQIFLFPPYLGSENLKIPIIGSKIKVVADLSSDLSKQARERH